MTTELPKPLKGRTALVTGAGRGIGKAIAQSLGMAGAAIVYVDLDKAALESAVSELNHLGGKAVEMVADVRSEDQIREAIEKAVNTFGSLDVLVNNARPHINIGPFPENMVDWDLALDVMLKAPALAVAEALPHLKKSGNASVINISSTNAFVVSQQPVTYQVAKAGLLQLTRYLAHELGEHGIRVNTICPGVIDMPERNSPFTNDPILRKVADEVIPLKRAGSPEEIGSAAVFLASDDSSYMTGQSIVLDGGITIGDQFYVGTRLINGDSPPNSIVD
jgi:glucose 1-dehydrogenase